MTDKSPKSSINQTAIGDHNIQIIGNRNIVGNIINLLNFGTEEQQFAYRNRQNMLKLVWNTWIEGVLKKSLFNEVLIELGMKTKPESVERPWDMVVQMPDKETRLVLYGTKMLEMFDQANCSLLILGEPGSGKTTMLLELCRQAIERAEEDPLQPIPVVFNLASWKPENKKTPEQALTDWLVNELRGKYSVPNKIGRSWIENNALLLLLDGLDEVREENRETCIQAINTFREEHGTLLAVCSRRQEYQDVKVQLNLFSAVSIQPLRKKQVLEYILAAGTGLTSLLHALQHDSELRKFAKTPLVLNILLLAYRNASPEDLNSLTKTGDYRNQLFSVYITQMFKRRGAVQRFSPEQTCQWLSWLSRRMVERRQILFTIENILPSWIPFSKKKKSLILGLIEGLISGISLGLFGVLAGDLKMVLILGLVGGLLGGLFVDREGDIKPTDKLIWSWKKARNGLLGGLVGGFIMSIILQLLERTPGGILGGMILGSILGLSYGLSGVTTFARSNPGDGIKTSFKNLLVSGLVSCLVFGLLFWLLLVSPINKLVASLVGGLIFGLLIGMSYGGNFLVQHFVSRWLLFHSGYLPWNIITFLDYCTDRIFLRRVGGSYIFIHRMVMEHFAAMYNANTHA